MSLSAFDQVLLAEPCRLSRPPVTAEPSTQRLLELSMKPSPARTVRTLPAATLMSDTRIWESCPYPLYISMTSKFVTLERSYVLAPLVRSSSVSMPKPPSHELWSPIQP